MQCVGCTIKSCGDDEQICYVIDNNGYIILSEENGTDSGRFFGEVESAVMEVLVNENIFKKLIFYDLQGMCSKTELKNKSAASIIMTVSFLYINFHTNFFNVAISLSK
jgi:hypothetical protein